MEVHTAEKSSTRGGVKPVIAEASDRKLVAGRSTIIYVSDPIPSQHTFASDSCHAGCRFSFLKCRFSFLKVDI